MQTGKFVVKGTKQKKLDKEVFDAKDVKKKEKHNDKAMYRALRNEIREQYDGFDVFND